jgi:hypothetical protein
MKPVSSRVIVPSPLNMLLSEATLNTEYTTVPSLVMTGPLDNADGSRPEEGPKLAITVNEYVLSCWACEGGVISKVASVSVIAAHSVIPARAGIQSFFIVASLYCVAPSPQSFQIKV